MNRDELARIDATEKEKSAMFEWLRAIALDNSGMERNAAIALQELTDYATLRRASALSAQQPVAWRHSTPNGWVVTKTKHMDSQPLYASPPPAQQQPTEEEVRAAEQILSYIAGPGRDVRLVAEAVLRMAGK